MSKSKNRKNARRKKKQVSKHMLKSGSGSSGDETNKATIAKNNSHIKHPQEAFSYLTQWKEQTNSSGNEDKNGESSSSVVTTTSVSWKFNKNTQSWLIRHMYELEKVSKKCFLLLEEYLQGLKGETMKEHIRMEASRRCRRYKKECISSSTDKSNSSSKNKKTTTSSDNNGNDDDNDDDDDDDVDNNSDMEEEMNDTKDEPDNKTTTTTNSNNIYSSSASESKSEFDNKMEEDRWKKLDDHDKRKEYKRARKVLVVMSTS